MPILGGLIVSFFSSIIAFFAQWFTRKVAIAAAAGAVFTGLTAALYGGLSLILQGVSYSLPNYPGVSIAMWVAAPPNLPIAISAVLGAEAAIALYCWNVKMLKLIATV